MHLHEPRDVVLHLAFRDELLDHVDVHEKPTGSQ
jgi:hypothetical protein